MKFIVYAPTYDRKSAGVRALHRLAWELQSRGYLTWVANARYTDPERDVPLLTAEYSDYWDAIAIYPEIYKHDPLNISRRVRWKLRPDDFDYGSDLIVSWSSVWAKDGESLLHVPLIDERYFYDDPNIKRDKILTYKADRVAGDIEITDLWPEKWDDLGALLRSGKILRCGDPLTLLAAEARFSGCKVEMINGEMDNRIPIGSRDFIARYREYEKSSGSLIDQFIHRCANYWPEMKAQPMKILVFCPTFIRAEDGRENIDPRTRESLENLEKGEHTVRIEISVDSNEDKLSNVIRQYKKAEKIMMDEGYDALLTVEDDMIIPKDALIKLAGTRADVVYGVYLFRHGSRTLNTMRAVSSVNFDSSLMHYPHLLTRAVLEREFPVSGLGMGCTLIHRNVLEKAPFHVPDEGGYPDGPLAQDCQRLGFRQKARFDVICGHIDRELNRVWYPNLNGSRFSIDSVKCKALQSFNGMIGDQAEKYIAGNEYQIPMVEAVEFSRAGLIEITERIPEDVHDV